MQNKYPLLKTVNFYLNKNKNVKKLPDPSVNWVELPGVKNLAFETVHPPHKNENDFILSYDHAQLDADAYFERFNVFNLMKNDSEFINKYLFFCSIFSKLFFIEVLHIYKFCQCKRGIQKVAPTNARYDLYTLIVDCDRKELIKNKNGKKSSKIATSTKIIKTKINDYFDFGDFDSKASNNYNNKLNAFLCMLIILINFVFNN